VDERLGNGPSRDELVSLAASANPTGMPTTPIGMGIYIASWLVIGIASGWNLSAFWWFAVAFAGGAATVWVAGGLIGFGKRFLEPRPWTRPLRRILDIVIFIAIVGGILSCLTGFVGMTCELGSKIAPYMMD